MNNNKSARRVHARATPAEDAAPAALALWKQNTLSLTTEYIVRWARDKKRFTACESKGEGPRQHQKISVRMCDQIELITLTCKAERWKGSAAWGWKRTRWGAARNPQRTPVQPAA